LDIEVNNSHAKIKVIGVGGGGNNAVNRMIEDNMKGAEFIAVNTDLKSLHGSLAKNKLQIGKKLTKGLGAGARPSVGEEAALEDEAEIKSYLQGADMVFITAGMGGGTGTGAAPVIARIAKDMGILTVGIVTKPFPFEGRIRMKNAVSGIESLRPNVDSLIIVLNENLIKVSDKKVSFLDAFKIADNVLLSGVKSVTDVINNPGLINLDFADIKTVMKDAGIAHMGIGSFKGDEKAIQAAKLAVDSPLLETELNGATSLLINITGGSDLSLMEINDAVEYIRDKADKDAEIIFGTTTDEKMEDEIIVTIIATGLEKDMTKAASSLLDNIIKEKKKDEYNDLSIPSIFRRQK
jgi:cell division protein FtsZ